jgi:hypothetical protein
VNSLSITMMFLHKYFNKTRSIAIADTETKIHCYCTHKNLQNIDRDLADTNHLAIILQYEQHSSSTLSAYAV